ncbi:MAG: 4Fe-4S cluster-binding domain-containing protein [Deltaproteobacteria bacterium]|nr:4Fe-4S cluster-binding domain-containing protein [Deltaproteobacteria bacterium]
MFRLKRKFVINRLDSGGLITNYYCTSKCKHCLYACSPAWDRQYIDAETTEENILKIKSLGCRSIHIGGGEPFLNLDGLTTVVETVCALGVHIEYVETNSSWYKDKDSACEVLSSLKESGLSTLLVSISPFHNEHIPFYKVKGVMEACRTVDMNIFPWIMDFYADIDAFDDKDKHPMEEYTNRYGPKYLRRALKTFSTVLEMTPYQEILSSNQGGCVELRNVSHFHFDLFGNYIPGLCSGLSIHRDDLGHEVSPEKYPLLHTLFYGGITGLFDLVSDKHGFKSSERYLSKCHLCLDLRRHLVLDRGLEYSELQPLAFYENA